MSEQTKPVTPTTIEELTAGIQALLDTVKDMSSGKTEATEEGYNQCIVAMWQSAYMTHEFVARELGVTGFQHSASGLQLIGALRDMEGPFMLVAAEQALYPQYVLPERVLAWLTRSDTREWLAEEAKKKLTANKPANSRVLDHWKMLASYEAPKAEAGTE